MTAFSKLTWLREARPLIRTLTTTQRDVLDEIFDATGGDGQGAHPSQAQIAEAIGKRERQVRNVLGQLRGMGLIIRTARGNKRLRHADVYALGSPAISDHRQSKVAGDDSGPTAGITGNPRLPVKGAPPDDYRQSNNPLPAISEVITGNAALPPNRPCTPDPGPSDPGMVGGSEDHPPGESEPECLSDSVSSSRGIPERDIFEGNYEPAPSIGTTDPFAGADEPQSTSDLDDDEIAAVMAEIRGETSPVENFVGADKVVESFDRVTKPMPWEYPATECIIRWPAGKPLPVPRDPSVKFVDETTGEPLAPGHL